MIRNLKALGLALVAVLAISAMAAAGAHAEHAAKLTYSAGTVKLDTKADSNQTYTLEGRTIVCTELDGSAAVSGTEASEVTSNTDVNYTNCHTTVLGISFPATAVQEANCHYRTTTGTYTAASNDAHGSVHICATTLNIYTNATNHASGTIRCQIHWPAQTVTGYTYTNTTTEGKMAVTVDVNASVTSTVTQNGSTIGCSSHIHNTATYTGNYWIKGTDASGSYTDVTVS